MIISHFKTHFTIYLTALAAAVVYGGWAVFVNYEHGAHARLMAGVIQGAYAFVSTLSITHVAKYVFVKCGRGQRGVLLGFLAGFIVMLSLPVAVHSFAGTPDILETILPGLIWGSFYLMSILVSLHLKTLRAVDRN